MANNNNCYNMKPIAHVRSPFLFKNGTPRQPTVCQQARGIITIEKSVFNNPEHSLEGMQDFTHVWILFIFHDNNNAYSKAKVKPPRLNGRRVGLFSTRSPYRPNNVGLTLAKIESISGATLTVSGIDMIDGTPVIDIKPYIQQYDYPSAQTPEKIGNKELNDETGLNSQTSCDVTRMTVEDKDKEYANGMGCNNINAVQCDDDVKHKLDSPATTEMIAETPALETESNCTKLNENKHSTNMGLVKQLKSEVGVLTLEDSLSSSNKKMYSIHERAFLDSTDECSSRNIRPVNALSDCSRSIKGQDSKSAEWINKPPIQQLDVRFTPSASKQLEQFSLSVHENNPFKFNFFENFEEARGAICNILHEDPRSTYRRKHCVDHLYYFTIDVLHVTCWFDDNVAEVVRVKPACLVEQCKQRY